VEQVEPSLQIVRDIGYIEEVPALALPPEATVHR